MLKRISEKKLAAVLAAHQAWREGKDGNRANLTGANLTGANLRDADFTGANLIGANLRDTNLRGANLIGANLRDANLTGADLTGAHLRGTNLRGARLTGARLTGAIIGNETIVDLPRRATRSDGYEFFLWRGERDYFVQAGCRWMSFSAARKHWRGAEYAWRKRNNPGLYHESLDILAFFEHHIKRERLSTSKESEANTSKESEATASKES